MSEHTCECGSVFDIVDFNFGMRDKDSLNCRVCGRELIAWNGATGYRLARTIRLEYRGCEIIERQFGAVTGGAGTTKAVEYLATAKKSGQLSHLKSRDLGEIVRKIDEFVDAE